jgi:hypothetical protein
VTEFTFRKVTSGKEFDAGCRGFLATSERLTDNQLQRLKIFWESNHREFRDGERFSFSQMDGNAA